MGTVQKIQTPQGALKYCFITGQGRLKPRSKDQYSYSAGVIVDKKAGKKLYAEICDFFNENKPSKCELDEPENNIYTVMEDGGWFFQFRTNTVFVDKKTKEEKPNKVKVLNVKNKETPLPEGLGIGDGSMGSVLGALQVYEGDTPKDAGCSMFLNAVRIAKFVKYEGADTFEDEGDGDFDGFEGSDYDVAPEPEEAEAPVKEKKKKKKKKKNKTAEAE